MARYRVTKNYSPENGLTATFRQWRAKSHCRFLHGYALGVEVTFECDEEALDENGWVANFGGLKPFKQWLCDTFDHRTLVAKDDPALPILEQLGSPTPITVDHDGPLAQIILVERTGCEGFAKMIGMWLVNNVLADLAGDRCIELVSVRVYEHTGNSATYYWEHGDD